MPQQTQHADHVRSPQSAVLNHSLRAFSSRIRISATLAAPAWPPPRPPPRPAAGAPAPLGGEVPTRSIGLLPLLSAIAGFAPFASRYRTRSTRPDCAAT